MKFVGKTNGIDVYEDETVPEGYMFLLSKDMYNRLVCEEIERIKHIDWMQEITISSAALSAGTGG